MTTGEAGFLDIGTREVMGAAGQSSLKIRLDLRERIPPTISLVDATVKMKSFAHPALGADSSASGTLKERALRPLGASRDRRAPARDELFLGSASDSGFVTEEKF